MNFGAQRPLYIVAKCADEKTVEAVKNRSQTIFYVQGESSEGHPKVTHTQPDEDYFECVLDSSLHINAQKHITVQIKGIVPGDSIKDSERKTYECLGNAYRLQSL